MRASAQLASIHSDKPFHDLRDGQTCAMLECGKDGVVMSLGIRKIVVVGLVAGVFVMANALVITGWLADRGLIEWAASIRREFLTGSAIAVIIALLILLMPATRPARGILGLAKRCPVCEEPVSARARYCGECGGRV